MQDITTLLPIYRYHAEQKDGWRYLYSPNPDVGQGWNRDGIAFYSPVCSTKQVPVYQMHIDQSSTYGGWQFMFCLDDKDEHYQAGWILDGIAFTAFHPDDADASAVPVYQFYYDQ